MNPRALFAVALAFAVSTVALPLHLSLEHHDLHPAHGHPHEHPEGDPHGHDDHPTPPPVLRGSIHVPILALTLPAPAPSAVEALPLGVWKPVVRELQVDGFDPPPERSRAPPAA